MDIAQLQLIVTSILAVAAVGSAIFAMRSSKSAQKAVKAQVIWEALHEYSQKEMRDSIKLLFAWRDKHTDNYGKIFRQMVRDPGRAKEVEEEDLARRCIALHFYKIWVLNKRGILELDDVKEVAERRQIKDILLSLVEPLEKDDYDTSMYDFFRGIYGISEKYR